MGCGSSTSAATATGPTMTMEEIKAAADEISMSVIEPLMADFYKVLETKLKDKDKTLDTEDELKIDEIKEGRTAVCEEGDLQARIDGLLDEINTKIEEELKPKVDECAQAMGGIKGKGFSASAGKAIEFTVKSKVKECNSELTDPPLVDSRVRKMLLGVQKEPLEKAVANLQAKIKEDLEARKKQSLDDFSKGERKAIWEEAIKTVDNEEVLASLQEAQREAVKDRMKLKLASRNIEDGMKLKVAVKAYETVLNKLAEGAIKAALVKTMAMDLKAVAQKEMEAKKAEMEAKQQGA